MEALDAIRLRLEEELELEDECASLNLPVASSDGFQWRGCANSGNSLSRRTRQTAQIAGGPGDGAKGLLFYRQSMTTCQEASPL